MKKYGVVFVLFCLAAVCLAEDVVVAIRPGKWQSPMVWRQLAKKMTQQQVADLMGQPHDKEAAGEFEIWYYQGAPQRENGKITWRPKAGFLRFKQLPVDGTPTYMLLDWKFPNTRELVTLATDINAPTPAVEADPAEPTTPAKVEVNQPVVQQPAAPAPAPEKKDPAIEMTPEGIWKAVSSFFKSIPKIWLYIGGAVLLFILYGIFKPDPRYKRKPPFTVQQKQPPKE